MTASADEGQRGSPAWLRMGSYFTFSANRMLRREWRQPDLMSCAHDGGEARKLHEAEGGYPTRPSARWPLVVYRAGESERQQLYYRLSGGGSP